MQIFSLEIANGDKFEGFQNFRTICKKILHIKQNFWPNFRLYNYEMN